MSLLGRIFGRGGGRSFSQAVAAFEKGDFARAITILREVEQRGEEGHGPSLAAFYLRQALVQEGRRRLSLGDIATATNLLGEAAGRWPTLPDIQFWYGHALGVANQWAEALAAAQNALRFNADYILARLLEAVAFVHLDRPEAASASLNALVDSGQRVDHALVRYYQQAAPFTPENLPDDLEERLAEAIAASGNEAELAAAIRLCEQGRWEEGITALADLCRRHPTYPDYRVKLAAALFQTHRNREALHQVDRALQLRPRYRTAAHLKALVLADQQRFREAAEVIAGQPQLTDPVVGHPAEELFCAYLGGVLDLLTGNLDRVLGRLESWGDLSGSFPRAEQLRAAVAHLQGRMGEAADRLLELAARWRDEADYRWQAACLLLERGRVDQVEQLLLQWPLQEDGVPAAYLEHALLSAHLAFARGESLPEGIPDDLAARPAWRFLEARAHLQEMPLISLQILRSLLDEGPPTAALALLLGEVQLRLDDPGTEPLPGASPPALVVHQLFLLHQQERTARAAALLHRHRELHPEDLRWTWLDPAFWLDPVRRWIG